MYFDFEDYRPDITPVGSAISWREGVLLSIIVHLAMMIVLILAPKVLPESGPARAMPPEQNPNQQTRFVFVQPKNDLKARRPPQRAEPSDIDRSARALERASKPENPLPLARGNTPERVEEPPRSVARGEGPLPEPAAGEQVQNPAASDALKVPDSRSPMRMPMPSAQIARNGAEGTATSSGGSLGDALKNLQRYVRGEAFNNPQGGGGEFGPEIQFDTKGVEFGPWIRRFIAQVKRNWFVPYSAMSMQGHVVITFNVHKDGSITDLAVVGPCPIEAFNNAAFGALSASNPTQPLPPEYPSDKAFFTVTFFYNESPR